MKLKTEAWGVFKIGELFDIHPTKAYNFTNSKLFETEGVCPVVVNSSFNNGVGGYTTLAPTETGNIITFSDTTSTDAIFYQNQPFVGYPHVQGLYPIGSYQNKWNQYSLLFFLVVFKRMAQCLNFDYVNKFTRDTAKSILVRLPVDIDGELDFSYMESYMKRIEMSAKATLRNLCNIETITAANINISRWKEFAISKIFPKIVKPVVYHTREVHQDFNGIPYIVRSKFNNGIKYRVTRPQGRVNPPNVISFGAENATFFYQKEEWISGRDMYFIDVREIDEYACLFIVTCLQQVAAKYSYNYGLFPELLKKEKIKLPIDKEGNPDFMQMSNRMKALEVLSRHKICVCSELL